MDKVRTLEDYLNTPNEKLLHNFGWGNEGERDFNQFIREVKRLVKEFDEAKAILNDCVNSSAVCNGNDYDLMRNKAYSFLSK